MFDSHFPFDPTSLASLSNNPTPCLLSSTGASSLDDHLHIGLAGVDYLSDDTLRCPSSSSGSGKQDSPCSGSETLAFTPGYTTLSSLSLPVTTETLTPPAQSASTPSQAQNPKSKRSPCADSGVRKRNLNTLAARRYRQKRTDETQSLAAELKETKAERDSLKILVARLEGELKGLQGTLSAQKA
jgi:hypothetical protein